MAKALAHSLGARLRDARRTSGLTFVALGQRVGVGAATVSRWERNRFVPGGGVVPALVAWARTLPASVGEPLAVALGAPFVDPAQSAMGSNDRATLERAVNDAILAAAESLDLGAKSFRRALLQVVAEMESAGAGLDVLKVVAAREGGGVRAAKKKG